VKLYFTKVRQTHWDNIAFNKLQPIKEMIRETKFKGVSKRRDELVLHRARIGHTYLMHCFILKKEDQPQCIPCQCVLSVEHILLTCPEFAQSRQKYFNVGSLKDLFSKTSSVKILNFVRKIVSAFLEYIRFFRLLCKVSFLWCSL